MQQRCADRENSDTVNLQFRFNVCPKQIADFRSAVRVFQRPQRVSNVHCRPTVRRFRIAIRKEARLQCAATRRTCQKKTDMANT